MSTQLNIAVQLQLQALIYTRTVSNVFPLSKCPSNAELVGRATIDRALAQSLAIDQHEPILLAEITGLPAPFIISGSNRILHLRWWDEQATTTVKGWFKRPQHGTLRAIVCRDLTLSQAMAMRSETNNFRSVNDIADYEAILRAEQEAATMHSAYSNSALAARLGRTVAEIKKLKQLSLVPIELMQGARDGQITITNLYRVATLNGLRPQAVTLFQQTGKLTGTDIDRLRRVQSAQVAQQHLIVPALTLAAASVPEQPLFVALDEAGDIVRWSHLLADVQDIGTPFRVELIPV